MKYLFCSHFPTFGPKSVNGELVFPCTPSICDTCYFVVSFWIVTFSSIIILNVLCNKSTHRKFILTALGIFDWLQFRVHHSNSAAVSENNSQVLYYISGMCGAELFPAGRGGVGRDEDESPRGEAGQKSA